MIEFRGLLSGPALKRFWKRAADYGQIYLFFGELFVLPIMIMIAVIVQDLMVIGIYLAFSILLLLLVRIPHSKKEIAAATPKRIYTDGREIVCEAVKYVERRKISDVKYVRDFGDYYELVFPFGRVTEKFICQKDLLSKGTLKKFESLFGKKIIRVNNEG